MLCIRRSVLCTGKILSRSDYYRGLAFPHPVLTAQLPTVNNLICQKVQRRAHGSCSEGIVLDPEEALRLAKRAFEISAQIQVNTFYCSIR